MLKTETIEIKTAYLILITESWKRQSQIYVCQNEQKAQMVFEKIKKEYLKEYSQNIITANCQNLFQMQFHPDGNKLLSSTVRLEIIKPEIVPL